MLISNTCSLTEDFHWVTSLEKDICSFKWPTIIREHVLYKVSKSRLELHFLSEITTYSTRRAAHNGGVATNYSTLIF